MSAVTDFLEARGVGYEVIEHQKAFTSIAEARTLGVEADEVLKTVVVDTEGKHALMVVPASRRLDMELVKEAVGDRLVHLASEGEIEGDFPGFELGALPPIGPLLGAETYVDPAVREHETVLFAGGSQTQSVRVRTADLLGAEPVRFAPLVRELE